MFKYSIYSLVAGLYGLVAYAIFSGSGGIKVRLEDKNTKEAVPFSQVELRSDSAGITKTISKGITNMDGELVFPNLPDGKYIVFASYVGYNPQSMKEIDVKGSKTTYVTLSLNESPGKSTEEITLYAPPVIDPDTKTSQTVTREEYQNVNLRDINSVAATTQGVYEHYEQDAAPKKQEASVFYSLQTEIEYNTEEYSKINDNEFKSADKDPLSTFSIDVDKASYSNVRRFITAGNLPPADAVRVEELINYFPYNYPQPKDNAPFSITTQYMDCPWNSSHNLIHIGIQGKEIKMDRMPLNNLVFLLDVSGSMDEPDKLPLLKSGLRLLVEQLRPEDKVAIVVYAGAAGVVLPPTSGNQREKIIDAIENLSAGGSTAGGEGINLAYKLAKQNFVSKGNNRIILATDGDFNVGVSSDGELTRLIEKQREDGVFLTVLGFGTGNYKDSKMEQLADKGNGNYAYIDNLLEAKKVLVKEMGGTLLTIAKDVKIQIEFNPAKVKAYRLVGYENRMLNKEDFNDDKKDAGELGSGHNVTAIYEIIPSGSTEMTASVDTLKYQKIVSVSRTSTNEVMTIKFRYKEPNGTTSKLITEVMGDNRVSFSSTSEDCRFALSVAEFGMLLRNSEFKGVSDYKTVLKLAKASKGKDEDGYRAEFIRIVEMAELLKK